MRALCITLNPAIDTTYVIGSFLTGTGNRVIRKHEMPGGKGNNVARILAALGHRVTTTGFLGGSNGKFIESGLIEFGVEPRFHHLASGESRVCLAIVDQANSATTEILESGPTVEPSDIVGFEKMLDQLLKDSVFDVVSISGSAPQGFSTNDLTRIGNRIRESQAKYVVDSSDDSLRALVLTRPDLISPNTEELNELVDSVVVPADIRVLTSNGKSGASLSVGSKSYSVPAPPLTPVNTVGCGDALLAGFLDSWLSHASDIDSLVQAVAFGSAAALQEVAGVVADDDISKSRAKIQAVSNNFAFS